MEVMLAVIVAVVTFPRACVRMSGFRDVGKSVFAMSAAVNLQKFEIIRARNEGLFVIMKKIGQRLQSLCCSVGPGLATPPATGFLQDKLRIVPLDSSWAELRE